MKNENQQKIKKGLLFNQCGLNIIQFKGERCKRYLCSPHTEKNNSMSSLQRNLLLDQGHPYPTPTILSVWQGPVLLVSLELMAAGLPGLKATTPATVFV